ncbi:methyltransferase domain-containing protein [Phytohabitans flavus]|uniref:Methyltransferase n=2 Tax=Phytohabitans flavus TaxID=1076124 RepID=A0A6F8XU74_9ACTN|nr:methyltransferase [Phytohabitans flavus]
MTDGLDLGRAATVVELGPGTGAITEAILPLLAPGARLIAVEVNPVLATRLAQRYRDGRVEVVHGSAADLPDLVPHPVDTVVSGLPWTVMPAALQRQILDAVVAVLGPGGRFSTFAYAHAGWTPPANRFVAELSARFSTVERGRTVWANLPPAYVRRAFEPRVPAQAPS